MDTNRLKRFATEARNILIGGVVQRLAALGFQPDGTTIEKPELMGGGAVFMGEVQTEDFYHQWMSLQAQVQRRSFREVAEEAAYTWFNRLVAIRIMVKNELVPAVLEYESEEVRIPLIVTEARQGRLPQMDEAQRRKLDALLLNDALTDEQFALLIVAYCHSNPLIQKCFGAISDYTELLLPGNILKSDGFIDRLNADDYITDADYRSPELIGWLYQFYISERKDEVFAKKGKFAADEIPAATQIFTPNWIVKYMVQNTVGRIYLDNSPYSDIKEDMQSWMFLSSFEKLRKQILDNYCIESMLHLGPRTFDELSGEVVQNTAFIISKHTSDMGGTYFRLVEGKNCADKERMFLQALEEHTVKVYYPNVPQRDFEKIPGCPIGYWVSEKMIEAFEGESVSNFGISDGQNITGDNNKYLRLIWETASSKTGKNFKWVPIAKGGSFRRWYGNIDTVINWSNEAREDYRLNPVARIQDEYLWYRIGITWNLICSGGGTGFRLLTEDNLFNKAAPTIIMKEEHFDKTNFILGFLNTKVVRLILNIMNPTFNTNIAEVFNLGIKFKNESMILDIVHQNISISRLDWDTHETSWDFRQNELITLIGQSDEELTNIEAQTKDVSGTAQGSAVSQQQPVQQHCINDAAKDISIGSGGNVRLSDLVDKYHRKWEALFRQLHANEEELNRQFIDIYDLQDELTPDVPLDEITILQQGEISIEKEAYIIDNDGNRLIDNDGNGFVINLAYPELEWHDDVIVKQLISYAVGCMMGRYSIDRPGLILANQGDGKAEYEALVPGSRFVIDDDGIIPLMSVNNELADHITLRFKTWLGIAFGEETLMGNINFVEQALGKRLEDYFLKGFWKDHKKMYQNRPIYWLFSSKKGAFQCIVYMHRMNAYTAEKVRTGYLLPHIEWLMARQEELQANAANLTNRERKEMDNIDKQITECREYHDRLHLVADRQIAFDLDDGVVVNYAKFGDVLMKLK